MSYAGGCRCSAVRFEAAGEATNCCYCHCTSCRRACGAPFVAWATFPSAGFRLLHGTLASVRSSAPVTRGFCSACGTSLTYAHDARPEEIDIALATLDDARTIAPEYHIWMADALPWDRPGDGLPQYRGWKRDA